MLAGFAAPFGLPELSVGGGLGVPYVEGEAAPSLTEWAAGIHEVCEAAGVTARVSAEPGLVLSPATATMQYKQSSDFDVRPQSAPTSDVSVAISVAATNPPSGTILPLGHVCKHLHTRTCAGGY